MVRIGVMFSSHDFHTFKVLGVSAAFSSLADGVTVPTGCYSNVLKAGTVL